MFRSSLSVSLSPNEEELEALHLKTHYSRNKALQKIKNKAHLLHERGVVHVPPPFAAPIDEDDDGDDSTAAADSGLGDSEVKDGERPAKLYVYSGQQSFDRRAFLASLEDAYRLRAGGYKEREPVVLPDEDSIDTLSIVALFAKVDTSGDGSVTREELVRNCHVLHLSVEDAHRLFDKLDVNGDGEVNINDIAPNFAKCCFMLSRVASELHNRILIFFCFLFLSCLVRFTTTNPIIRKLSFHYWQHIYVLAVFVTIFFFRI